MSDLKNCPVGFPQDSFFFKIPGNTLLDQNVAG